MRVSLQGVPCEPAHRYARGLVPDLDPPTLEPAGRSLMEPYHISIRECRDHMNRFRKLYPDWPPVRNRAVAISYRLEELEKMLDKLARDEDRKRA